MFKYVTIRFCNIHQTQILQSNYHLTRIPADMCLHESVVVTPYLIIIKICISYIHTMQWYNNNWDVKALWIFIYVNKIFHLHSNNLLLYFFQQSFMTLVKIMSGHKAYMGRLSTQPNDCTVDHLNQQVNFYRWTIIVYCNVA